MTFSPDRTGPRSLPAGRPVDKARGRSISDEGDVPAVTDGRILGHEAVGTIERVGAYDVFARAGDTGALKVVLSR